MPVVYFIPRAPLNTRNWCRLGDVLALATHIMREVHGHDFTPTPTDLVKRFVLLVRKNKAPTGGKRKRFFRYSPDGKSIRWPEVPPGKCSWPEIRVRCGVNTYITEEFAHDILDAILEGMDEVGQWGKKILMVGPKKDRVKDVTKRP
ncbi:MAG: hypothetical protein PHS53_02850 [Candidatus Pacebacteria bacterium]|nr:hypothetical protein [Candidatus Paceibacterota bacterium]